MSEINKINTQIIEIKQKQVKGDKETQAPARGFEDQLLKTVQKLETIGEEIDGLLESQNGQTPGKVTSEVSNVANYIKSMEGLVENLSGKSTSKVKSAKFVADQYNKMNPKKES
ncbi:MAG: hypothetical protein OEY59_00515 [Deltaproteobacteria bacterium]|nr:hypothetical protein [Deltaproteobacteria bacterium]